MSTTLLIVFGVVVAVLAGGGILVGIVKRSAYNEGKKDAQLADAIEADKAKDRANAVLAEHRDPDSANDRLRDGTF